MVSTLYQMSYAMYCVYLCCMLDYAISDEQEWYKILMLICVHVGCDSMWACPYILYNFQVSFSS